MQERERQREAAAERQRQQSEEQELEDEDVDAFTNSAMNVRGQAEEDESISDNEYDRPRLKDPASYDTSSSQPGSTKSSIKKEIRFGDFNDSSEEDKKPSATSRSTARGKHVRILPPHHHAADSDPLRNEKPAFPAFYSVTQDEGASVYNDGDAVSFVIRVVPFGVVILGQELSWRKSAEDGESRLMVRMPDGWVKDSDLERVTAVPL
jgi:hypothetical protein